MTERNPSVVVTSDETLQGVVDRLRGAASGGRTVDLVVPIDSPLLLTANEFRTLKRSIDDEPISVVLRTADPLRLQLGERLGIHTRALPRTKPIALSAVPPSLERRSTNRLRDAETTELRPFVAEVATRPDPALLWPTPNGSDRSEDELACDDVEKTAAPELALLTGNPPRRWLPVAALLALLVAAAFLVIQFVIPKAVVKIVPKVAPIETSLFFDLSPNGQPRDAEASFAMIPRSREMVVKWEGDAPVTGARLEPDGVALGPIELRNASTEPLTIEAGTTVTTETGVGFAFVDAVTVPAMDPASGVPGAATGKIRAANAGSIGNVPVGEVGGRLLNGVYYSNRMEPTSGGTDKTFPVVAQADLEALTAAATDAVDGLATDAIGADGKGGDAVLLSTTISKRQDEFDRKVGDDAETVALRSTLTIEATTFDAAAARSRFEPLLEERLASEAPQGFVVDQKKIAIAPPTEVSREGESVRLQVIAHVEAEADLSEAERQALVASLAGASAEEAKRILSQSPDIAEFSVDYSPGWFVKQMPNNASRIELEIAR